MVVTSEKYIIILKDKFVYERILDREGYLVNNIEYADMHNNKDNAQETLLSLDNPNEFEVIKLKITYEF